MEKGYTYIDVKPTIPASNQTTAFIQGDVLFDWTEVRIPAGVGRLIGVSVLMRGVNGAAARSPLDVYFSKSNTFSLGTPNSAVDMQPNNDLLGALSITQGHYMSGLNHMEVANMTTSNRVTVPSIEIARGNHRIYIAGVAQTGFNFSTNVETTAIEDVSTLTTATVGASSALDDGTGSSSLCLDKFGPGDIIHAYNPVAATEVVLGEIETVAANTLTFRHDGIKQYSNGGLVLYDTPADLTAWKIQNGAGAAGDLADGDELYNVHPITLKLSFAYGA